MMKSHRHEQILRLLAETGTLTVSHAVKSLGASMATVRRDFNDLATANLVERERGGIRLASNGQMLPFSIREVRQASAKLAIARKAVSLLSAGDVLFVDGGTTTLQLASCLPPIPLRIITNSLGLAGAIEGNPMSQGRWEVFLTGGYLFPSSGLLVGPRAQAGLEHYHADWAMLSASGLNEDGVFNDNEHVVETERVMIAHADKVAILADHTKIGRHAMCHIAKLDEFDYLVTNTEANHHEQLAHVVKAGGKVLYA